MRPISFAIALVVSTASALGFGTARADMAPEQLPHETAPNAESSATNAVATSPEPHEPEPAAPRHRVPFHVYPSARVTVGAGWLHTDSHLVFDVSVGINAFRQPGIGTGVLVGFTRRPSGPEWTALTLGVPFGYVSHHARFAFGVRPDLLVGRASGTSMIGGRGSVYLAYRQSVFVEGGYERLRIDGQGVDGYRIVAGIDLGVVIASLFTFGGSVF